VRANLAPVLALFVAVSPVAGRAQAPPSSPPAESPRGAALTDEKIDQLTAPIALYPDALLSQVLMASTYPDEVKLAAKWSKQHPGVKGDEAVKQVASQPWDPSVQSLVAFPQVLATLEQKPDWVKQLGDAFLAQPEAVMDSVQRLRAMAKENGSLESNEQQNVQVVEAAPQQTVIQIEPANPQVVYVPSYNPTVVYGAWPYPAYPPVYIPPPLGFGIAAGVATGIAYGVGIGVTSALWGGFNWGRRDVDINVNRYNRLNVNRQLNVNQNGWTRNNQTRINDARAKTTYQRTAAGRSVTRARPEGGAAQGREAQRARAQEAVQKRQPGAYQGTAQQRAQGVDRQKAQQRAAQPGVDRQKAQQRAAQPGVDRQKAQQRAQGARTGGDRQRQQARQGRRGGGGGRNR
jgi:hypothetical protein